MGQADMYYAAMLARDYRFDGKFFVGVKTTGIYCRPICPARPKRENVEFYPSALAAQRAGYRPCLRCRPESAPQSPTWHGRSAVVQRALRVISNSGLGERNENDFAESFGLSARHLRRLFVEEVGLTPQQIAQSQRLDFARKLVVETSLPMTQIAMSSNFASLRRFNDAFKKRFNRSPTDLRSRRAIERESPAGVTLSLSYRPPFDFDTLLSYHRSHAIEGLEIVSDEAFERVFRIDGVVGSLRVTHSAEQAQLKLQVAVGDPKVLFTLSQRVRAMFDLESDPLLVANTFQSHPFLARLCETYPGLRMPRGFDAFESAIATILGQLVSLDQARRLVAQVVEHYGDKVRHPASGASCSLFPTVETLARAPLTELRTTQARKRAIAEFARAVLEKRIDLSPAQDPQQFREAVLALPGIGPWSAEYISMRSLGDTNAFPQSDLILKRALDLHPGLEHQSVQPWRAYLAIYLWKEYATSLSKKGVRR